MECRVNRPIDRDVVQVFLFEDFGDRRHVWVLKGDGIWEVTALPPLTTMPVSFEMRPGMFAALIRAGSDFEPPSSAQARHLDDAITVRDRLLALVEQS